MSQSQSAPLAPGLRRRHSRAPAAYRVIAATKQTAPDRAEDLVKTLVEQALNGTVMFQRNLTRTVARAVAILDGRISAQLNEIMHNEKFLKLEGSWRGLHYLVNKTETGPAMKIRVLNASKDELTNNFDRMTPAQELPLAGSLRKRVRDGRWRAVRHADRRLRVERRTQRRLTLRAISAVAAGAFAPFIRRHRRTCWELQAGPNCSTQHAGELV